MNIFFEKKIESDTLSCFLSQIFNLNLKEILVFEENYFFNNMDIQVDENIKCLCLYILVEGDVEIRAEIYRAAIEMNKMIDNVALFLKNNPSIGSIYVEKLNTDEFYLISSLSIDGVILSDEILDQGLYQFDRIA